MFLNFLKKCTELASDWLINGLEDIKKGMFSYVFLTEMIKQVQNVVK